MSSLPSKNAVYVGEVVHRRHGQGPTHHLRYRVALAYLNLDHVEEFMAASPLYSATHIAPLWFRRRDFFGDPERPLSRAIADRVEVETGVRPSGPIVMLANLRSWGWLFNPITIYYCFDSAGREVEHLLFEVENTPWHERLAYCIGAPGAHRVEKQLHVSPFLPMGLGYEISYSAPAEHLAISFSVMQGAEEVLHASMALRYLGGDRRSLARLLWAVPAMTFRVSWGIYISALRLKLKGAIFYPHPRREPTGVGRTGEGRGDHG